MDYQVESACTQSGWRHLVDLGCNHNPVPIRAYSRGYAEITPGKYSTLSYDWSGWRTNIDKCYVLFRTIVTSEETFRFITFFRINVVDLFWHPSYCTCKVNNTATDIPSQLCKLYIFGMLLWLWKSNTALRPNTATIKANIWIVMCINFTTILFSWLNTR